MGLHWDYRMVVGDKAFSFATKKEMPEPGKAIVLFEQPVHTSHYALSKRVEIPDGQYGAGTTTLDYVRKGTVEEGHADGTMIIRAKHEGGEHRFLLKKLDDSKYGRSAWLFKNLTQQTKEAGVSNKYLEKIARMRRLPHGEKSKMRELIEGELSGRAVDAATPKKRHKKHKHIEKAAIALTLYEHPVTQQRRWFVDGKEVPAGWVELKKTYKKFPKKV